MSSAGAGGEAKRKRGAAAVTSKRGRAGKTGVERKRAKVDSSRPNRAKFDSDVGALVIADAGDAADTAAAAPLDLDSITEYKCVCARSHATK